jgi:hypothetical protein
LTLRRKLNTLDIVVSSRIDSSSRLIEEYILAAQLVWMFVYHFSKAIMRNPEEVDVLKTFTQKPRQGIFAHSFSIARTERKGGEHSDARASYVEKIADFFERKGRRQPGD